MKDVQCTAVNNDNNASMNAYCLNAIKTYGPRYLGSKRRLLPYLARVFARIQPKTALDAFTGTTRVAQLLRAMGVKVTTVDVAEYSRAFSRTWVSGVYDDRIVEYYAAKLDNMSATHGYDGWFTKTYCDVVANGGTPVRFMTPENGRRVDYIRDSIEELYASGKLNEDEKYALITTLIMGMDRVDNTMGVQRAYLKHWCKRAKLPLYMQFYRRPAGPTGNHIVGDILNVMLPSGDVAYIDPPYTSMNYGATYHIWESIVKWDRPEVALETHRRLDLIGGRGNTAWNDKRSVVDAFSRLFNKLDAKHLVISYSDSALISIDKLIDVIKSSGRKVVSVEQIDVNEYIASSLIGKSNKKSKRIEFIIHAKS